MALRIPIKAKSVAALTVPLVLLLVVAGLEVAKSVHEAREVRQQTDLATASIGPSGLVTTLQNERNFATMWMIGTEDTVDLPVDSIDESRRATDAATEAFGQEVARKGGDVERIYSPALAALEELDEVRALVDGFEGPHEISDDPVIEGAWHSYSRLITALSDQNSQLTIEVADDELRQGVRLIDMASREVDRIAQFVRVALLVGVTGDGRLADLDEIREASPLRNEAVRWHYATVELASRGRYAPLGEELRVESDATGAIQAANEVVETGDIDVPAILASISIGEDESYYGFVHDVSEVIRVRSGELNAAATARQRWFMAVAGLVLTVASVVASLVARSITRPLRALTRQAKDMAERRLPAAVRGVLETPRGQDVAVPQLEPVDVSVGDEVAEVVDTLNVVQSEALDLAIEQAVLRRNVADALVNLARRNQNLVSRQLAFITELEADETDPTTIANLFRLDHHATRMRRNAESLLVLAGTEPARRWPSPVSLTDIVRAALSEVEDFSRADIQGVAPAKVAGSAVADLAHLLAELIENALRFSPPNEPVTINGGPDGDGYTLAVTDAGLGMGPDEIDLANRRLAGTEDFTVAPSRYLGHFVAGTLAARHGIAVRLHSPATSGLTAAVHLPARLLTRPGAERTRPVGPAGHDRAPLAAAASPAGTGHGAGPRRHDRAWDDSGEEAVVDERWPPVGNTHQIGGFAPPLIDSAHAGGATALRARPSTVRRSLTSTAGLDLAPPPAVSPAEMTRRALATRTEADAPTGYQPAGPGPSSPGAPGPGGAAGPPGPPSVPPWADGQTPAGRRADGIYKLLSNLAAGAQRARGGEGGVGGAGAS